MPRTCHSGRNPHLRAADRGIGEPATTVSSGESNRKEAGSKPHPLNRHAPQWQTRRVSVPPWSAPTCFRVIGPTEFDNEPKKRTGPIFCPEKACRHRKVALRGNPISKARHVRVAVRPHLQLRSILRGHPGLCPQTRRIRAQRGQAPARPLLDRLRSPSWCDVKSRRWNCDAQFEAIQPHES